MTKEEIEKKLKEIEGMHSPEERIKILEEINDAVKEANSELHNVYVEAKDNIDNEKARKIVEKIQE